jgi:hypothetical protein
MLRALLDTGELGWLETRGPTAGQLTLDLENAGAPVHARGDEPTLTSALAIDVEPDAATVPIR